MYNMNAINTNDIKKGAKVLLRNGWLADVMDNRKGNLRCLNVYGDFTEMGDCYSHDILAVVETSDKAPGYIIKNMVKLTEKQKQFMRMVRAY